MARSDRRPAAATTQPTAPNSRRVAFEVLRAVLGEGQPLDQALAASPRVARLDARDRAFVRMVLATTLRRLGQVDDLIDAMLERPLRQGLMPVRDVMRLGVTQIVFLGVPDHAAVSATVNLMTGKLAGQRGLVNAVLRRIVREGQERAGRQDPACLNTAPWLWESWSAAYGEPQARAIANAHLNEPPLDLSLVSGQAADREHWAGILGAETLPTGSLRLRPARGDITKLPGFTEGAWWVQDAAARLPARLLGEVAGADVLDLCAAPGGKTAQLAAAGAEVIAVDASATRLKLVQENLRRLGLAAATVAADVAEWRPPKPAGKILLDAPCSSTGTLRRHPDIQRLKTPADVTAMAGTQARLVRAAAEMLAPGGTLVYAVCSLQPEEGPAVAEALLAERADLERVPVTAAEIGGLAEAVTPEGDLRTLPSHLAAEGGLDGFYACRIRRRA